MIRTGIVGYGYWGPNLARNLHQSPATQLVRVADLAAGRLQAAARALPGVETTRDAGAVTRAGDLEAVVIATPASTHYELALDALRHGKHVLVEKPLADSVARCEELIAEARRRERVLLVDHTFVYTEAVAWIRRFVEEGRLGDPYYIDSIRANLGLFQHDVSVLWDLAPHDLSVLHEVLPRGVISVIATGACHAGSRVPDIAHLILDLGGGCLAHFHVSWLSPVKLRRMVLAGSRKMIVFDDLETAEKVKVYDSGVSIEHEDAGLRMQVEYRIGDMTSPALSNREALRAEVDHFARCIRGEEQPRSGGESGLAVVRILEAAQRSMEQDGERVYL